MRTRSRPIGTVALVWVLAWLAGAAPASAAPDRIVVPTGQHPTDVENVQDAVAAGGTVLLAATNAAGEPTSFDFGSGAPDASPTGVDVRADVHILGETVGSHRTTIRGGHVPFLVTEKVRTRIQGIDFASPRSSAVVWIRSADAAFVDNRVVDVVGVPLSSGLVEGRGIKFLGNADPDGAITGRVLVAGNAFDDLDASLSDAIVFDAVAADVTVRDNAVGDVQDSGILVLRSSGDFDIRDNTIVPGAGVSTPSFGNGVVISGSDGGSIDIRHNAIDSANTSADAILVFGSPALPVDDLTIAHNDLTLRDSVFEAVAFIGDVRDATVTANRMRGRAGFAALSLLDGAGSPTDDTFVGNQTATLQTAATDVFLDRGTSGNTLVGRSGTVVDLGTDNTVTGFHKGRIGRAIGSSVGRAPASLTTNPPSPGGATPG